MIPKSCLYIRSACFRNAEIKSIEFQQESQLIEIEASAFELVGLLSSVYLPESLEILGDKSFASSSIQSIYIGKLCSDLSPNAFSMCSSLKQIEISKDNIYWSSENNVVMNSEKTTLIFIPPGSDTITLPETIEVIGKTLLQEQENLINITLTNKTIWDTKGDGVLYSNDFTELISVCGGITSVVVDLRTISLEENAMQGCKKLKTITFDNCNNLTTIGGYCFYNSSIETIVIQSSVTTIGVYAFSLCSLLTTVTFESDSELSLLGNYCFENSHINSINIPDNVTSIPLSFMRNCQNLDTITFSESCSVTNFSKLAFYGSSITRITLPKSLKFIDEQCFKDCFKLSQINISQEPDLTSIETLAFNNCNTLETITLPLSCTSVKTMAFAVCSKLSKVEHHLIQIEGNTFQNCTSLTSFIIPPETESIDPLAFTGCIHLNEFKFEEGFENSQYSIFNGFLYSKDGSELVICPPARKSVFIPENTSLILQDSFKSCTHLEFVSFSQCSNITTFVSNIFSNCHALKEIILPPALTSIDSNCFAGCSNIKTIVLPPTLKSIGQNAFSSCSSLRGMLKNPHFLDQNVKKPAILDFRPE